MQIELREPLRGAQVRGGRVVVLQARGLAFRRLRRSSTRDCRVATRRIRELVLFGFAVVAVLACDVGGGEGSRLKKAGDGFAGCERGAS